MIHFVVLVKLANLANWLSAKCGVSVYRLWHLPVLQIQRFEMPIGIFVIYICIDTCYCVVIILK